tara:strand:- start:3655 stop:5091 length:1437 start_codon:yes stop_codon:yes gene_type:complete
MSIRKNFAYNAALTISNFIFPLIVFPYVSRTLGVSNIGLCGFVDSIINYFILFSMLGISIIGIREVAKNKNTPKKLESIFSSLFTLNAISTFLMLIILILLSNYVPRLIENKEFMFLGGLKLISNLFLIEWFFRGIENFKFITIRSILVKTFFVISVFIFVRDQYDVLIYYGLITSMVALNAFLNWSYRKRLVNLNFKSITFKPFIKSFFILGLYMVFTSMYTTFNVAYLGFTSGDVEVGYYATAVKIYELTLAIFTAFTAVMLPRISSLVSEGKFDDLNKLISSSYNILITFSIPLIIILLIFTPQIILIIAGQGFEGAILPMRIISPLILIIGIEQILIIQLMMPYKMDKVILRNSVIGATLGIILNIVLVPSMKSTGSAIVWLSSEILVLISAHLYIKKSLKINFPLNKILLNIIYSFPVVVFCVGIQTLTKFPPIFSILLSALLTLIYFLFLHICIIKNNMIIEQLKLIKKKIF